MQRFTPSPRPTGRAPGIPPPVGLAPARSTTIATSPAPLDDRDVPLRSARRTHALARDLDGPCGSRPMAPAELRSALRALPAACHRALRGGDQALVEEVARLRDELHAVANRVTRLLAAPDARLATMDIGRPTALAGRASPELVLARLAMAAERLADIADRLGEQQWRTTGQLGSDAVTIGQLVALPLQRAHRIVSASSAARRNDSNASNVSNDRNDTVRAARARDERAPRGGRQPSWRPPKRTQQ